MKFTGSLLFLVVVCLVMSCTDTSTHITTDGDLEAGDTSDVELILPTDGDKSDGDSSTTTDGDNITDGDEDFDLSMCGVGDSEKTPSVKKEQKVYYGTDYPSLFDISAEQQMAVGALVYEDWWGGYTNFCTATLVASNVVLTAAHCLEEMSGTSQFGFAIGKDASDPDAVFAVKSFEINSEYNASSWVPAAHDNAIIVLKKSVYDEVSGIKHIPMNADPLTNSLVGQKVQNVGYGSTEFDQNNSERLWVAESVYTVSGGEFTVNGKGHGGVCFGDSGGPSLYDFGDGLRVIGTVSWGDESCVGVDHFSDISVDSEWLSSFIEDEYDCGDIDEVGECQGNTALWCDYGVLIEKDCSDDDKICGEDDNKNFRCITDNCDGLTYEGTCKPGNIAAWCEDNSIKTRHCLPCNQYCGYVDSVYGYYCKD